MEGFTQLIPVKHVFTNDEIEKMGRELASEEIALKELQGEFAEVKSSYNNKIKTSQEKISEISNNIDLGEITKELECEIEMNTPTEGKKTCTPVDGGSPIIVDMEEDDFAVLV